MKQKMVFPTLILCLGMLNGCGAARPSKFYELTVPSEKTPEADPAPYPVTLLLGSITTSHLYRDDHIVYTSNGEAMGTYENHRWAKPPSEMIHDVLLRELQRSGPLRAHLLLSERCSLTTNSHRLSRPHAGLML